MEIKLSSAGNTESCEIVAGGPCGYVIFGASGDLSHRKLIPAVFSLFRAKKVPHNMFATHWQGSAPSPNVLIFDLQPQQGTSLPFQAKVPGSKMCLAPLKMELDYRETFGAKMDEDYSTLILDCMLGDQTLYWRKDGVETSWKLLNPVLKQWERGNQQENDSLLEKYPAGGWGPEAGTRFIEQDGRQWIIR